jgi:hypothetical protein
MSSSLKVFVICYYILPQDYLIKYPGYDEYDTGRTYLAKMGDWRKNKDEEVELDGIGGVNVLVKADVHRSGRFQRFGASFPSTCC